jgi:NTP pyrophosphatase (non-canonical NTP hydrolase)
MNLEDYSKQAITTLAADHAFGTITPTLMAQILGLVGESGEVAEKFKKLIRDKEGIIGDEDKQELVKELGDILWYVSSVSHLLGYTLGEVAQMNLDKLASRKQRNQISGSGDNR